MVNYMSEENVKKVIKRLLCDDIFRTEFLENPKDTLISSGYSLDLKEMFVLSRIRPSELKESDLILKFGDPNSFTACNVKGA